MMMAGKKRSRGEPERERDDLRHKARRINSEVARHPHSEPGTDAGCNELPAFCDVRLEAAFQKVVAHRGRNDEEQSGCCG